MSSGSKYTICEDIHRCASGFIQSPHERREGCKILRILIISNEYEGYHGLDQC